jgi:hypothetical protein
MATTNNLSLSLSLSLRVGLLLSRLFLFSGLVVAAVAQAPVRPIPPPSSSPHAGPARPEPCWQVAGVTKSALQQRRVITQQARQITSVCANSSLSLAQKRQEVQQIHRQERQQIDALITPAQQQTMRSCQEHRNPGHISGGYVGGGHGNGPCGETPSPRNSSSQSDEEEPPPGKP